MRAQQAGGGPHLPAVPGGVGPHSRHNPRGHSARHSAGGAGHIRGVPARVPLRRHPEERPAQDPAVPARDGGLRLLPPALLPRGRHSARHLRRLSDGGHLGGHPGHPGGGVSAPGRRQEQLLHRQVRPQPVQPQGHHAGAAHGRRVRDQGGGDPVPAVRDQAEGDPRVPGLLLQDGVRECALHTFPHGRGRHHIPDQGLLGDAAQPADVPGPVGATARIPEPLHHRQGERGGAGVDCVAVCVAAARGLAETAPRHLGLPGPADRRPPLQPPAGPRPPGVRPAVPRPGEVPPDGTGAGLPPAQGVLLPPLLPGLPPPNTQAVPAARGAPADPADGPLLREDGEGEGERPARAPVSHAHCPQGHLQLMH